MKKKLFIDILMFILMLLEFSKGYLSNILHEIIGIILLLLLIIHLILNRTYLKNIPKGKYNTKRIIIIIVDSIFILSYVISIILGILTSEELFISLNVHSISITKLHKIISYLNVILLGLHLGINFTFIFGKLTFKNKYLNYFISFIFLIYGIYSFIKIDLYNHLIGIYQYGNIEGNLFVNIARYLGIIIMLSIITNYLYKIIKGGKA